MIDNINREAQPELTRHYDIAIFGHETIASSEANIASTLIQQERDAIKQLRNHMPPGSDSGASFVSHPQPSTAPGPSQFTFTSLQVGLYGYTSHVHPQPRVEPNSTYAPFAQSGVRIPSPLHYQSQVNPAYP